MEYYKEEEKLERPWLIHNYKKEKLVVSKSDVML